MGMPNIANTWTREAVLALPEDGNRYELVDGELLVSPAPRLLHQAAVLALFRLLDPYVDRGRLGMLLLSPADLDLRSGQLVQPDLFVVPAVVGRRPSRWEECGIPLLIAEVLSPSTARYDRITKRRRYQRSGVPVYWMVDIDARLVEVWAPGDDKPAIIDGALAWNPTGAAEALIVDLPAFFRGLQAEPSAMGT